MLFIRRKIVEIICHKRSFSIWNEDLKIFFIYLFILKSHWWMQSILKISYSVHIYFFKSWITLKQTFQHVHCTNLYNTSMIKIWTRIASRCIQGHPTCLLFVFLDFYHILYRRWMKPLSNKVVYTVPPHWMCYI